MAKKNNAAVAENTSETTATASAETKPSVSSRTATPDGFEDVTSDVVAVYDYRTTTEVFIRPLGYTLSDSKDKKKPAILIHAELLKPAVLIPMGDERDDSTEPRTFATGSRIGLWYRPGMRGIMQCSGTSTYLAFTGEKDVGQIQAMKTFKVSRKKSETSAELSCLSDFRKQTRYMPLPWEDASTVAAKAKGGTQPAANDDDDVPF